MTDEASEAAPPPQAAAPTVNGDMAALDSVRVDKWLWAARCFKTRGLASEACGAGHVKLNGTSVKSAKLVRRGDELTVRLGDELKIFAITGLSDRRGPAPVARTLYEDKSPPKPEAADVPGMLVRDRGLGRPTKRELRDIRRVRGY
ncbi:MAG TPA: RNA-binding S4 domain-containing protein [Nannocystis sp.]